MAPRDLLYRLFIATMSLCIVSGCSKKDVLEREVRATTTEEFAASRESFAADLSPTGLKDFDTAIQEVKYDAMNKGLASVALREQWMRTTANGKSVQQVLVLGWQARRSRLLTELEDMNERYAHDSKLLTRSGSEDSTQFLRNITRNEEDKINQLKGLLADVDQKLTTWGAAPASARSAPSIQALDPKTSVVSVPAGSSGL